MALDIGSKRTGVALVDDQARVATPLCTISHEPNSARFVNELNNLITEWEPVALVVGLPIDLRGGESIAAENIRNITAELISKINDKEHRESSLDLHFVDERLTTVQVENAMKREGVSASKRKEIRDALAAAQIAQIYIDSI